MNIPRIVLLSLFPFGICTADPPRIEVDSERAHYDGKAIRLSGAVRLKHETGEITGNEVILYPAVEGDKKQSVGSVAVKGNALFTLRQGGELSCSDALLDRASFGGVFYGSDVKPLLYRETIPGKSGHAAPLAISGKQMELSAGSEKNGYFIERIATTDSVEIRYGDALFSSDRAGYRRNKPGEGETPLIATLPGLITLESEEGRTCHMHNEQGTDIRSKSAEIDLNRRLILLHVGSGSLFNVPGKGSLLFSSRNAEWALSEKRITLTGDVRLEEPSFGVFKTNDRLHIIYAEVEGKKRIDHMTSYGDLSLFYRDAKKNEGYLLTSSGRLLLDHPRAEATVECLRDPAGSAIPVTRVRFRTPSGEMTGEKLHIAYTEEKGKSVPSLISFTGDVLLSGAGEKEENRYYALADKVVYNPATGEICLFSDHPTMRRVLYYDKVNQLQISASALTIKREEGTKKQSVEGIGNVRLSFLEGELAEIRRRFNLGR